MYMTEFMEITNCTNHKTN